MSGLRLEYVPCCGQAPLELKVVLDDAVMHQGHAVAAVGMRMGIVVGRRAVGRPASVSQAQGPARRGAVDRVGQSADLADRLSQVHRTGVVDHGDAGAVVAAVF